MTVVVQLIKPIKYVYNSNILVLNSLLHRFTKYRGVLYIVTLLVAGSVTFISVVYSMYKSTAKEIDKLYLYDLSFIVPQNCHEKLENVIRESGAEIKTYNTFECIEVPKLVVRGGLIDWVNYQTIVMSISSYNKLTNKKNSIKKGHAIYEDSQEMDNPEFDNGFILDFPADNAEHNILLGIFYEIPISLQSYETKKGGNGFLYVANENILCKPWDLTNQYFGQKHFRSDAIIINDEDYKVLKQNSSKDAVNYDILANLKNKNNYKAIYKNLSASLYKITKDDSVARTLVLKQDKLNVEIQRNGFNLFIFSFLGAMLLVGSAVTLYFKIFTSLEEDKSRVKQLIKLGLRNSEINKIFIKELGTIFIFPPIAAIAMVGYYLHSIYVFLPGNQYWNNTLIVFVAYGIVQILFFIITSNKYLRDIKI